MPRYAHQKPVSRLYSYNYGYMNNYYKPLTHYMERKEKSEDVKKGETTIKTTTEQIVEKPGHQSLAEWKGYGVPYPYFWFNHPWEWDCVWVPPHECKVCPHFGVASNHEFILKYLSKRPWISYTLDDIWRDL